MIGRRLLLHAFLSTGAPQDAAHGNRARLADWGRRATLHGQRLLVHHRPQACRVNACAAQLMIALHSLHAAFGVTPSRICKQGCGTTDSMARGSGMAGRELRGGQGWKRANKGAATQRAPHQAEALSGQAEAKGTCGRAQAGRLGWSWGMGDCSQLGLPLKSGLACWPHRGSRPALKLPRWAAMQGC